MAEAAGIALAVFPLVIKGLGLYIDALETIKKLRQYRKTLQNINRRLLTEQELLKASLAWLLLNSTNPTNTDALLQEPGGDLWRDEPFHDDLQAWLGSSYDVFLHAVEGITDTLEELKEEVGLDTENNVNWMKDKIHKRLWKKVQLTMREGKIETLLETIDKDNRAIAALVGHGERTNRARPSKISVNARKYENIRNHARSVYNALKDKFSRPCDCTFPHSASLRLEYREGAPVAFTEHKHGLCFKVLFSFDVAQCEGLLEPPWGWRETRIEPLDTSRPRGQAGRGKSSLTKSVTSLTATATASASPSGIYAATGFSLAAFGGHGGMASFQNQSMGRNQNATHTQRPSLSSRPKKVSFASADPDMLLPKADPVSKSIKIEDLCKAMLGSQGLSCLGVMADDQERCHRVSITSASSGKDLMQTVSLQDLLAQADLGKKERLVLGVKLASTLLQLHDTPWLDLSWGKLDVRFRKQGDGILPEIVGQPFLSQNFGSGNCQASSPRIGVPTPSLEVRNRSIFALGLVLIELWFGKTIEDLRLPSELGPDNRPNSITDFATAIRLVNEVYREAGLSYGDAVRRCIRCDFNVRDDNLEAEALKEAVHHDVLGPLQDHLSFFCGGSFREALT